MMEYRPLGKTGLNVSRICFGSLTMAPLQGNLPPEQAAEIMAYGFSKGINFVDCAQLYRVYPYVGLALKRSPLGDNVIIASKSYAYTGDMAREAVDEARRGLNRDVIDIFLLHEQESIFTVRGHREALDALLELKAKGVLRAVGLSTHHVAGANAAAALGLDVLHPLINVDGWGIVDGTRAMMEQAILRASAAGVGIYTMKAFGGGNLHKKPVECLDYVRRLPGIASTALGMQSREEIDANVQFFESGSFTPEQEAAVKAKNRRLFIEEWCIGCGKCVDICPNNAARVIDGRMEPDRSKCVLCGYCAGVCGQYAIKVL